MKLYGVPLSQPFRSVAWSLLQHQMSFDIQLCVPGATSRIGSLHESFLQKSRTGTVPLMETNGLFIGESPVILSYLAETQPNWSSVYAPPGTARKVMIDSYLHWHHTGTRSLATLSAIHLRPDMKLAVTETNRSEILQKLAVLNDAWLTENYIAGNDLSIADFMAYEEIAQLYMTGLLEELPEYPNVHRWVQQMEQLPYHKEAHVALTTLGNLAEPNEVTLTKRLGAATKAGIDAFQQAQKSYTISKL